MTPLAQKVARELTLPLRERRFNHEEVLQLLREDIHCFDISAIAKPIHDAMMEANVWLDVASMLPDLFLPSPVTWLEFVFEGKRHAYVLHRSEDWFCMDVVHLDKGEPYGVDFGKFRSCSVLESPDRIALELPSELSPQTEINKPSAAITALLGADAQAESAFRRDMKAEAFRAGDPYLNDKIKAARQYEARVQFDLTKVQKDLRDALATRDLIGAANHVIAFAVLAIDLINTPGIVGLRQHVAHAGSCTRN